METLPRLGVGLALAAAWAACAGIPAHATRQSPPPGIEESALAVGSLVPELMGPTTQGTFSLSEQLSRGPVVLLFYRGVWCPYCRTQLGEVEENLAGFRARGAAVVAVSVDSVATTKEMAERLGLTFPVLADEKLVATRALGVEDGENGIAWPSIFVIARDRKVAWRSLSETYKERATSAAVQAALDKL